MKKPIITLFFILLVSSACGQSRPPVQGVKIPIQRQQTGELKKVVAFPHLQFERPLFLTHAGDSRLFVIEQKGNIHVFRNTATATETSLFLDHKAKTRRDGNEEGLLGLAFDPNFATNHYFYIAYTPKEGRRRLAISRFKANQRRTRALANSEKVLIEIDQPYTNHNGGMIAFGPDKMLYISVGDGGHAGDPHGHGQNRNTLLATILRIDPRTETQKYKIPKDNPFVGVAGVKPEIYAYGLRNVWRFSFDRKTGVLWAADVGQNAREEINHIQSGGNYGWNAFEGNRRFKNTPIVGNAHTKPIWEYRHHLGSSVTGGYVYRGLKLASLRGSYVYGDFVSGRVWALKKVEGKWGNREIARIPNPSGFGEDRDGELYATSFDGKIYRFENNGPNVGQSMPEKLSETGIFENLAELKVKPGILPYDVNVELWSDGSDKKRWLILPGTKQLTFSRTGSWKFPVGTILMKHFEIPGQRLETRLLVHDSEGWIGHTYKWNAEQTDAKLVHERIVERNNTGALWTYPSPTDCMRCHNAATDRVLGLNTFQAHTGDQLAEWQQLKVFQNQLPNTTILEAYPKLTGNASTEKKARAYFAVNCSHCHRPDGPTPVNMDLRYRTELADTKLLEPAQSSDNFRIMPRNRFGSEVFLRMRIRGRRQMPPIATHQTDQFGIQLIGKWIDSLPGFPN